MSYPTFADGLLERLEMPGGPVDQQDLRRMVVHATLETILIRPLTDFGCLITTYGPHEQLGPEFQELDQICLTSLGRVLLENANTGIEALIGKS